MAYEDGSKQVGGKAYRQHQTLKAFIRERDGYTCRLCGEEGWMVDHIVAWGVSHDSTVSNLRVLCHACNLKTRRERRDARSSLNAWHSAIELELNIMRA